MSDLGTRFAQALAARQRLIVVRGERVEQLSRLRAYIRVRLGEFLDTLDPVTGARFAELTADGNAHSGSTALTLTFLDGTRLRLAIDDRARYTVATTPDLFEGLAFLGDLRVRPDLGDAEVEYETLDDEGRLVVRTESFERLLGVLVDHVVHAFELQVPQPPQREGRAVSAPVGPLKLRIR